MTWRPADQQQGILAACGLLSHSMKYTLTVAGLPGQHQGPKHPCTSRGKAVRLCSQHPNHRQEGQRAQSHPCSCAALAAQRARLSACSISRSWPAYAPDDFDIQVIGSCSLSAYNRSLTSPAMQSWQFIRVTSPHGALNVAKEASGAISPA